MGQYDELYADANTPITVSEEPFTPPANRVIDDKEIERLEALDEDAFILELEAMTPENRALVENIIFGNTESELMEEQMRYGEELRGAEAPGMRQMGRLHQAANPLEFIAPGMDRYEGRKMRKEATTEWEKILERQEQARTLRANRAAGVNAGSAPAQVGTGMGTGYGR